MGVYFTYNHGHRKQTLLLCYNIDFVWLFGLRYSRSSQERTSTYKHATHVYTERYALRFILPVKCYGFTY